MGGFFPFFSFLRRDAVWEKTSILGCGGVVKAGFMCRSKSIRKAVAYHLSTTVLRFESVPRFIQRSENCVGNHPLLNRGDARVQLHGEGDTRSVHKGGDGHILPYLVWMQFCDRLCIPDLNLVGGDQLVHPNLLPIQFGP